MILVGTHNEARVGGCMASEPSLPIETVELCVHGVSGTPPEDLLHCAPQELKRVAGDKHAGFYRQRVPDAQAAGSAPGVVREGYSWGELTSGPATRALFLLFLPFTLVNLAHWMLPPVRQRSGAAAWSVALLRVLGLSLTVTLLLATASTVMDVTAWQCGSIEQCRALHWGVAPVFGGLSPGQRVAVSAVVPALFIYLLLVLAYARRPEFAQPPSAVVASSEGPPLSESSFWGADRSVSRLRMCHVISWNATLGLLTCGAALHDPALGGALHQVVLWLTFVNALWLLLAAGATVSNRVTGRGGSGADALSRPLQVLAVVSVATLAAGLIVVGCSASPQSEHSAQLSSLPGLHIAIYALLNGQFVVLVLLAITLTWSRPTRSERAGSDPAGGGGYRPTLWGYNAFFMAMIAWVIAGGFSAGLSLWTAKILGRPSSDIVVANEQLGGTRTVLADPTSLFTAKMAAFHADVPLLVPSAFIWAGYVFTFLLVAVVACVVWVAVRDVRRATCDDVDDVCSDYRVPYPPPADLKERVESIARSRAWARVTDAVPNKLALLISIATLAFLVVLAFAASGVLTAGSSAADFGIFLLVVAAAGLVLAAIAGFRNRTARRVIGILWDVMTFWPRANHPITPPCYGEWAVPQLAEQLQALQDENSLNRVVLVAHSQGGVIAAATLLQTDRAHLQRAALLTFGSPLRRLYACAFPAYFGHPTMTQVKTQLPDRWINMWAVSDPIGGWVFNDENTDLTAALAGGTVDARLNDVELLALDTRKSFRPVCGHSGFWDRPEYTAAIEDLLNRLPMSAD